MHLKMVKNWSFSRLRAAQRLSNFPPLNGEQNYPPNAGLSIGSIAPILPTVTKLFYLHS